MMLADERQDFLVRLRSVRNAVEEQEYEKALRALNKMIRVFSIPISHITKGIDPRLPDEDGPSGVEATQNDYVE